MSHPIKVVVVSLTISLIRLEFVSCQRLGSWRYNSRFLFRVTLFFRLKDIETISLCCKNTKTSSERNGKHVRRTCARRELHRHGFMSKEFLWKISFLRMWTEKLFLERDAWLDTKSILSLLKANKMLACDFELKLIYIFFVHILKIPKLNEIKCENRDGGL